jgi:predicted RNA-binding protein YlxR (DUF448 family)
MRVAPLAKFPHQIFFSVVLIIQPIMKPSTSPPQTSLNAARHKLDTIRKTRFFHVIDHRSNHVTVKVICEQEDIKHDRGKYLLKQRKRLDDVACRRKPRSGRSKKVSDQLMNEMLNPQTNPVRDQSYTVQLKHFYVDVQRRTLQRAFAARNPRAGRYKKARVRSLSQKNIALRIAYDKEHENHTIENF